MRYMFLTIISLFLFITACGVSTSDSGSSCQIEGTYSVTASIEDGNCSSVYSDVGSTSDTTTMSFFDNGDGTYEFKLQSLPNSCTMKGSGCKVTGACDILFKDGSTGTVQLSANFNAQGLIGVLSYSLPAIGTHASCSETDNMTGTRR